MSVNSTFRYRKSVFSPKSLLISYLVLYVLLIRAYLQRAVLKYVSCGKGIMFSRSL